jgi:hypothetical protein
MIRLDRARLSFYAQVKDIILLEQYQRLVYKKDRPKGRTVADTLIGRGKDNIRYKAKSKRYRTRTKVCI